jgi:predicted DNA-binding transcriptional regulator YafY
LIESGENVDNEKLAFKYDTSIKTINRDIEVLRLLNPNRNFFLYRQGYTTVNGHNNASKISVKISKRQEALLNQVSRLIDLYQLLKMGLPIHVEETCAKYKISDRSLRRDIKLFKDVNPDRKISFDKVKGYY